MVVTRQQLAATLDNLAAKILVAMPISQENPVFDARGDVAAETPQCGAHSPCPTCAKKIREAERERDIARAERDTAEALVKDLEIRLKDASGALTKALMTSQKSD